MWLGVRSWELSRSPGTNRSKRTLLQLLLLCLSLAVLCGCGPVPAPASQPAEIAPTSGEQPAHTPVTPARAAVEEGQPSSWWTASCKQGYIDVAVGMWHRCAVCAEGTVHCAGRAAYHALGAEVDDANGYAVVSGVADAVEVALGLAFGCMRTRGGEVACWGWNKRGQLGSEPTQGQTASWRAEAVDRLDSVDALAAGRGHACALLQGRVWCWGANDFGQLGVDGPHTSRPHAVSGIGNAVQIVAGLDLSCARLATREVACWGDNRAGQLDTLAVSSTHVPVLVPLAEGAVDIATDGVRVCALDRDGVTQCWGGRTDLTASVEHQKFESREGQRVFVVENGVCIETKDARLTCMGTHQGQADVALLPHMGPIRALDAIYDGQGCVVLASGMLHCWGEDPLPMTQP